ncbi:unnamed protein product [Nyctereutes procyonoides]|uniref:(raccoon dog) hypothetical protein n=1 Tax=Nyctereutes procyonoides TaxID=34880 RepID=A0A811Y5U9_NYCPR|nr:unnamed protein product [Nyctereutes procyonoides]
MPSYQEEISRHTKMAVFHDEVEIKDLQYDKEDLEHGKHMTMCPSCFLIIKVIYDKDQFMCG